MKLENGEGTISKLSGNRRKPYMVRSAIIYNPEIGIAKREIIGYAKTQKEALKMLHLFNEQRLNLKEIQNTSLKILIDYVLENKKNNVTKTTYSRYKNFCNHLEPLFNKKIYDLKYQDFQIILDNLRYTVSKNIIVIIKEVYKESIKREIVNKDISQFLLAKNKREKKLKSSISDEDVHFLWSILDNDFKPVAITLIQLYTGCRVSEILDIKIENIHLEERYFIGGLKTKAGKDRIIPIHKKIIPLFQTFLNKNPNNFGNLFLTRLGTIETINNYKISFNALREKYGLNYTTHYARHTFISKMQSLNVSISKLKKIVGHKTNDVTDSIYTHYNPKDLIEVIDMLEY